MPRLNPSEKLNKNNKSVVNEQSLSEQSASEEKQKTIISPDERDRMIRETAFYLAEREGFTSDNQVYWLRAEEQIDKMLNG